jgi:dTDP-4-dehydrorhamnose reductase
MATDPRQPGVDRRLNIIMIELWGGIECTVNRVGDHYFDQVAWTGHERRLDDLDRFAELGLRTLRYPVLWERVIPDDPTQPDWTWTDERLARLRELGIRPIVGLCHHGSGPRWTGLLDPEFPHHMARFARMVIERYPWLDAFTPINEPLTTARFAALYGHWHPHGTHEKQMARALIQQCQAVRLAMQEIRHVNPTAQLVQTEDLGYVWSTPALKYQADYENDRRWLSLDLLFGRVTDAHPIRERLIWLGVPADELQAMADDPCPPDVVGGNYYVTSERFLDHRLDRYPERFHGGNGYEAYADIEAVRVRADGMIGARGLLKQAWERYGRQVALTEAHLGATTPQEQVRWVGQLWRDAVDLEREGIAVRAVTIWSLLGMWNWHCLVTRDEKVYEPGVFDTRRLRPQPTALAALVRSLAAGNLPGWIESIEPGWWERPDRLLYPPVDVHGNDVAPLESGWATSFRSRHVA